MFLHEVIYGNRQHSVQEPKSEITVGQSNALQLVCITMGSQYGFCLIQTQHAPTESPKDIDVRRVHKARVKQAKNTTADNQACLHPITNSIYQVKVLGKNVPKTSKNPTHETSTARNEEYHQKK
jgi:hypothetical protein